MKKGPKKVDQKAKEGAFSEALRVMELRRKKSIYRYDTNKEGDRKC